MFNTLETFELKKSRALKKFNRKKVKKIKQLFDEFFLKVYKEKMG